MLQLFPNKHKFENSEVFITNKIIRTSITNTGSDLIFLEPTKSIVKLYFYIVNFLLDLRQY